MMHPALRYSGPRAQRGAVLIVGLIVLMLITIMVAAAFKFSTYNLKAVGNMQAHNEAIAAANKGIEQVVGSRTFTEAPIAEELNVDIDNDGVQDYTVSIAAPLCVKATKNSSGGMIKSPIVENDDGTFTDPAKEEGFVLYSVIWEVDATATSTSSGSRVRIRQGVSKSLTQEQCNAACPQTGGGNCS